MMSNKKCCVPGCAGSTETNHALHRFPNPVNDKERFNSWVYSISGELLHLSNEHIFNYRRVCNQHFELKYCCRYNRLSKAAVPTLFMPDLLSRIKPSFHSRAPLKQIHSTNISMTPSTSKETAYECGNQHEQTERDTQNDQIHDIELVTQKENRNPHEFSNLVTVVEKNNKCETKLQANCFQISSRKTRKFTNMSIREHHLYRKLTCVGIKLSKCRNKVMKQKKKIKLLQNITQNPILCQTLNSLPSTAKIITLMQFREHKKKDKGRRFTIEEKLVALSILKQSPKGYRFLRKIFILPAPQTLVKLITMANIRPGLNKNVMEQIKKRCETMKTAEKLCIVLFDEMSLKANVSFNERKDKVVGFVTDGNTTRPEFADHAQVFMVRGLVKNYKQPVSYTFSQSATKGPELAKQLKAVIKELLATGLIVVATVCDQGTNNTQCLKLLVQEARAEKLRKGEEQKNNVFTVEGTIIVPLYDPPHLLKCIRNNLMTKNLIYVINNKTQVAWIHIQNLHQENPGYKGIRLIPKLTDSHVVPQKIGKMKVKFATQLFSQTVASNMGYLADKGILPMECKGTADLLLFFDNLFDSVNGSYTKKNNHGKPLLGPAKPNSVHHKFWQESKIILKTMKFINADTKKAERGVPTLNNWVWTLEGIELLIKTIKEKYEVNSIWLRHLNQDPIENFFGTIRSHGCRNNNPTPENFESAFTTLLINNLSNVQAQGANCELDNCNSLHQLIITKDDSKNPKNCEINIPEIIISPLENKSDPRQISGLIYVSGYFVKNVQKKVFKGCTLCKNELIANDEAEYLRYREYAGKRWLCSPSVALLNCVSNIQDINCTIIKSNLEKNNLMELIRTMILMFLEFDFLTCQEHKNKIIDYLITISCRFFIHNYCKEINKILYNKRQCDDDDDLLKLKAKRHFSKCMKRKIK